MTTTKIQQILERIEKLKESLQQKNAAIADKDREIGELSHRLEDTQRLLLDLEGTVAGLKRRLAEESASKTEAFGLASQVEAITKSQKELFELRQKLRHMESERQHAGALAAAAAAPVPAGAPAAAASPLLLAELAKAKKDAADKEAILQASRQQVADLEKRLLELANRLRDEARESAEKDEVMMELQRQMEELGASPAAQPQLVSAAQLTAWRDELAKAFGDLLPTSTSPINQAQAFAGFLAQVRGVVTRLRDEMKESAEKDEVMMELQRQLVEAQAAPAPAPPPAGAAGSLSARLLELESEVATRDAVLEAMQAQVAEAEESMGDLREELAEKDEIIRGQQLQIGEMLRGTRS